jgi:hypothetical protein
MPARRRKAVKDSSESGAEDPPKRKTPRPPTKAVPISVSITDGENDIANLPPESLRAELIGLGYHPGVVHVLKPWLLGKVLREHYTYFRLKPPHPHFESSAQPRDADNRRGRRTTKWDACPVTIVFHPMNISSSAQPLQTTIADVDVKQTGRVVPDELPVDLNTAMLDAGSGRRHSTS